MKSEGQLRLAQASSLLALLLVPLVFDLSAADPILAPKLACWLLASGLALFLPGPPGREWLRSPVLLPLVGWIAWAWASALFRGLSPAWVLLVTITPALVWIRCPLQPGQRQTCQRWMLAAWALSVTYSWLQRLGLDPFHWSHPALSRDLTIAGLGNPNYLAMYLGALLPLAWTRAYAQGWLACLLVWLGWVTLLLTSTRGALLAVTLVLLGSSLWGLWRGLGNRKFWLATWLFLGAGLGASMWLSSQVFLHRFSLTQKLADLQSSHESTAPNILTRLLLWKSALRQVQDQPLLGSGPGQFGAGYLLNRNGEPEVIRPLQRIPEDPHSEPLRVLSETGVPGLVLWSAWLLAVFIKLRRQSPVEACCLAVVLLHSLSNCWPLALWPLIVYWSAMAQASSPKVVRLPLALAVPGFCLAAWLALGSLALQRIFWWDDEYRYLYPPPQAIPRRLALLEGSDWICPPWFRQEWLRRSSLLWKEKAHLQGEAGAWARAIHFGRRRVLAQPGNAYAWRSLAGTLQESGQPEAALEAWASAARLDPENPAIHYLWAQSLYTTGQLQGAESRLQRSLEIYSKNSQVYHFRSQIMIEQGRTWEGYWDWIRGTQVRPAIWPAKPGSESPESQQSSTDEETNAEKS